MIEEKKMKDNEHKLEHLKGRYAIIVALIAIVGSLLTTYYTHCLNQPPPKDSVTDTIEVLDSIIGPPTDSTIKKARFKKKFVEVPIRLNKTSLNTDYRILVDGQEASIVRSTPYNPKIQLLQSNKLRTIIITDGMDTCKISQVFNKEKVRTIYPNCSKK